MARLTAGTPSRLLVFAALTVAGVLTLAAGVVLVWSGQGLRKDRIIRGHLRERHRIVLMSEIVKTRYPGRREALRACYRDPERVDFSRILWSPLCRPTPFVGYMHEPGLQAGAFFNAQQLRDRRDVALPKPSGVFRVFVTGGSFAFGSGAPDEDSTIPAFLERFLHEKPPWPGRRVEVFNAAVCAWTSAHERILIENRLCQYAPDLVIALSGGNDAHWGFAGQNILDQRAFEDELFFMLINHALDRTGGRPFPFGPPLPSADPVAPEVVAERLAWNLKLAAAALDQVGALFVFALQPALTPNCKPLSDAEKEWLEKHETPGKPQYLERCYAAIDSQLANIPPDEDLPTGPAPAHSRQWNLRVANLKDVFSRRPDPIFFDLFHVGDKGNGLVARRLADEVERIVRSGPGR